MQPDPAVPEGYAPIDQAATIGKVSTKTIRNWAYSRLIASQIHKRPGITPIKVYNVADINREASKQAGVSLALAPQSQELMQTLLEVVRGRPDTTNVVPVQTRVWLTLREAVQFGIPAGTLKAYVREGKLENVGTPHRFRFRRRDLEGL